MPNANDLGILQPTQHVKVSYTNWSVVEQPAVLGATQHVLTRYVNWSDSQLETETRPDYWTEYDHLAVQSAPHGVKMRGHLLSGGFESWTSSDPNTNNPSGLPIENIVISDEWEG